MNLRDIFLGKSASRPGKEVVAGGGGFEKSIGNPRNQVWKEFNGNVKSRSDLCLEKQFPNLFGNLNQERFGGFNFFLNKIFQLTSNLAAPCMKHLLNGPGPFFYKNFCTFRRSRPMYG